MWTKRESTEEGSTLRELVEQVSLLAAQTGGTEVFSLAFFIFFLLYSKEISWACLIKSFSSFLGMFLLFFLCGSLISLQRRPPQGFETCNGTNESCRLLFSLILIATLLAACKPTETFRFSPPAEVEDWIWKISKKWEQSYYPMSASVVHKLPLRVVRHLFLLIQQLFRMESS